MIILFYFNEDGATDNLSKLSYETPRRGLPECGY